MKRREFVTALGSMAAAAALPVNSRGQQAMPTIGLLSSVPLETRRDQISAFHLGLKEAGYVEGQNVAIEYRSADNRVDRLSSLADELVTHRVSVIVTIGGDISARAAKSATTTIPIVFVTGSDAVKIGLVTSLNRPGGNLTGVSFLAVLALTKQLELLSQLAPDAPTIGLLVNPDNPNTEDITREARTAAATLRKTLVVLNADTDQALDEAFVKFAGDRVGAVSVTTDPVFLARREHVVALATMHHLPAIYSFGEFATAGGLMSYGTNLSNAYRQAGIYACEILKGKKAGDLPVMQATKFELVINMKTAKALGIEFPAKLLAIADSVIE